MSVFIWDSERASEQHDIQTVLTGKVKIKRLRLHGASNKDAGYDRDVALDIRDLMQPLCRRVGYNFSYSRVSSSLLL